MLNFTYILWAQSESTIKQDVLLVDGNFVQGEERAKVFSYINFQNKNDKRHQWKPKFKNISKLKSQASYSSDITPSFNVYVDNLNHLLVKSHFLEKDEVGRPIVYVFCSSVRNIKEMCLLMENASKYINRSVNPSDVHFLQDITSKVHSIKYLFLLIIILTILLLWLKRIVL